MTQVDMCQVVEASAFRGLLAVLGLHCCRLWDLSYWLGGCLGNSAWVQAGSPLSCVPNLSIVKPPAGWDSCSALKALPGLRPQAP